MKNKISVIFICLSNVFSHCVWGVMSVVDDENSLPVTC